ncbi:MAG: ABC transporter permease [Crocinitomicaceae bacterium]
MEEVTTKHIDKTKSNRWERIWLLAKIEFKLRYYENSLGLLWALIKPIAHMLIYYVAFKIILSIDIPNYALYLFCGLIVWNFFIEASSGLMNILRTKKYLYEYSNMSKFEIYLASMLSISIGFAFNLIIFIVAVILSDLPLSGNLIYFALIFLILFTFSMGLAMILSSISIIATDIKQIWPLIIMGLFWLSPILFTYENVQEKLPFMNYSNPMAGIILNSREVLMYAHPPDWKLMLVNIGHALIFLLLGLYMVKKIGSKASEIL